MKSVVSGAHADHVFNPQQYRILSFRRYKQRRPLFVPRREKTGFLHMRKHRRRSADQRLCFRYTDSTIPLLPKSEISSFYPSSVAVQPSCIGPGRKPRKPVFSERGSFVPEETKQTVHMY